jgi:MarR family
MTIAERLFVVRFDDAEDVSALYLADPERFQESFEVACASAIPWSKILDAETIRASDEAFQVAKGLLESPDLMKEIEKAIRDGGYAGDVSAVLIAYFAVTSRVLERPINAAYVAQSSAGKTAAVEAALELHPSEAVFKMDAGSERALIYNDESYEHRTLFVSEADSIPEDGPAASAVRAIADSNQMTYDVVERDETTSRQTTRRVTKPGPTGVITTSVRSPRPQLGTRMFEVTIRDDEAQTRAIMREQARRVSGMPLPDLDVEPFHALQRWIALQETAEPIIPYSMELVELIPANQVRLRRDLPKIFSFIMTSALLHQCQRERDSNGRLICTLADYELVRGLLAPIFDAVLSDGVTPAIRATVNAVPVGQEVSQAELGSILGLSKQTLSYRVGRAVASGWLVNEEHRRGHPARISRGMPLPEERSALPTVAAVIEASNCPTPNRGDGSSPLPICPECGRNDAGCRFHADQDQWLCEQKLDGRAI